MTARTLMPMEMARWTRAAPFWMSYLLPGLLWWSAAQGGWWIVSVPLATWWLFSALDAALGLDEDNADLATSEADMKWYRLGVMLWAPVQFATLFALIWYVPRAEHLSGRLTPSLAAKAPPPEPARSAGLRRSPPPAAGPRRTNWPPSSGAPSR
jgi:hypothetical protein